MIFTTIKGAIIMMQGAGMQGKGANVKSKSSVKQKITFDFVDIEKGVYVDVDGNDLGPMPEELLKNCRKVRDDS